MRSESTLASACSCKQRPNRRWAPTVVLPDGELHGVQAEISRHGNGLRRLCAPRREKTRIMPNSVGPAVGEHAITVQWCERDPSAADDRKLTFVYDPTAEVTVINASEIRLELSGADEPKVLAAPKRVTRPRPRQSHVAAVQPNTQQQQQAEAQRKAAQRSSRFICAPSSWLSSYATI